MITISLCMIVKNEEQTLERCLQSVKDLVDEINIVDTGSTDQTVEIARKFTDRIFHYAWTGNFAAARNHSFSYSTKDYTLFLDADDVLLEEDRIKFMELKRTLDPSFDSVSMYYNAGVDEYGNVTLRYRRNRLVKTSKQFKWYGDCHNYLSVSGKTFNSDIAVTHKKIKHSVSRNLGIYESKVARGDVFSPRDYFYYGNELRENGHYEKAIENYNLAIESKGGWVEDKIFACIYMADCYRWLADPEKELSALYKSFMYAKPRAEAVCRIGDVFLRAKDFKTAEFWYQLATTLTPDPEQWSFSYPSYYTWYPNVQLCICYYYIGDFEKADDHNEKAAHYIPDHDWIRHNRRLFERKRLSQKR